MCYFKKQSPEYGGLQSTLLQQTEQLADLEDLATSSEHNLNHRYHWAVISTIGCDSNNIACYDCLFEGISVQTVAADYALQLLGSLLSYLQYLLSLYKEGPCLCVYIVKLK